MYYNTPPNGLVESLNEEISIQANEIDRLRDRVAELESQVEMLSTPHTNAWFEAKYKERGERVAELEEKLIAADNRAEGYGAAYSKERNEWEHEYKQRGERMKEMRRVIVASCGLVEPYHDWFDPETGEPL